MKHFILFCAAVSLSGCVSIKENTARPVATSATPVAQAAKPQSQNECAISTEYVARYGMEKARKKLAECEKQNTAAQSRGKPSQKIASSQSSTKQQKNTAAKQKKDCAVSLDYISRVGFEKAKKELEDCDGN